MTDNTNGTLEHHSLGIDRTAGDAGDDGKGSAKRALPQSSSESPIPASGFQGQTLVTPMQIQPPFTFASTSFQTHAPDSPARNSAAPNSGAQLQMSLPAFALQMPRPRKGSWPPIMAGPRTSTRIPSVTVETQPEALGNIRREPLPSDDYVNASYVQPLGTRKMYIATQGPLPATFLDFWTLVWEQNVHVIVMLTREVENAMVKCGTYWTDKCYGPFRLELLSTSPPLSPSPVADSTEPSMQGFFFTLREPGSSGSGANTPTTITRRFALSHTSYPGVPPRRITHLQYLDWPDMNVPDDPRGVLDLVKRVERAVAESTPGPSPSGSLSPGSSLSPESTSPGPSIQRGQGMHKMRGHGWRHPELDPTTGVAAFALGKSPPVLLHCSAGVGRTGGFIAVDAALDGIRRELRKLREKKSIIRAKMRAKGNRHVDTETGTSRTGSRISDDIVGGDNEGDSMDVDPPSSNDDEPYPYAPVHRATALLHVTAGERKHGRKHCGTRATSSESLVLHVPIATVHRGVDDDTSSTQFNNPRTAGWKPSSTREWAEQVSDQTHTKECCPQRPTTPMFISPVAATRRAGSPSSSNSSGPSVLNSADDSVGGSASGSGFSNGSNQSASGGASGSGSSRACVPPSSSASISLASGSVSASNSKSGSGSGTGSSSFGHGSTGISSVMRSRLADSSATSLSNISAGSPFPKSSKSSSGPSLIHQPSAVYRSSRAHTDMDVDEPPRAISVPLQRAEQVLLDKVNLRGAPPPQHPHGSIGSSPVASLSAPSLTTGTPNSGNRFGNTDEPSSPTNSNPSLDELMSPRQESESGRSADANSAPSICIGKESKHAFTSEAARASECTTDNFQATPINKRDGAVAGRVAKHLPLPCDTEDKAKAESTPVRMPEGFAQWMGGGAENFGPDIKAKNPIIDYKMPRELHSDISPPLLSSYQNPICKVIQDMREQRMSLCQSLRQYVFVHAAVIEGALQIVDEERQLWDNSGGSDDGPDLNPSLFENAKGSVGSDTQGVWIEDACSGGGGQHFTTAFSSSSPTKGKRGPSPTELLKEDRTGALSLAKRPSVKRKTPSDEETLPTFESNASSATGSVGVPANTGIAIPLVIGSSGPESRSWSGPTVE
ncbi:hypothetical protein EDC04DRAFT_809811 [Pisolithus marmoratus]|nr:hypothetical protein EDC04DRAFT_809811 [Pisolithus marmoratus]